MEYAICWVTQTQGAQMKKGAKWGRIAEKAHGERFIETAQSAWRETLEKANGKENPYPAPVGHRMFTHPTEYGAHLVEI